MSRREPSILIIDMLTAAKKLPETFQHQHPSIEWTKIARSRNIIVHDYFSIDHEIIWRIIKDYLPKLISDLGEIS